MQPSARYQCVLGSVTPMESCPSILPPQYMDRSHTTYWSASTRTETSVPGVTSPTLMVARESAGSTKGSPAFCPLSAGIMYTARTAASNGEPPPGPAAAASDGAAIAATAAATTTIFIPRRKDRAGPMVTSSSLPCISLDRGAGQRHGFLERFDPVRRLDSDRLRSPREDHGGDQDEREREDPQHGQSGALRELLVQRDHSQRYRHEL